MGADKMGADKPRAAAMLTSATERDAPGELDVVVLGGGGHVGLPLSLVLARSGARVGQVG